MGRSPGRSEEAGLNRGAWTAQEDRLLSSYVMAHGEGKWTHVPKRAGLNRSGKSCRLRWLNYLRPDIKRGNITHDEEELIIKLHKLLGNRWSLITGRLPGRTDNEIKNYWNTTLAKKLRPQSCSMFEPHPSNKPTASECEVSGSRVIKTKATRCKNVVILDPPYPGENEDLLASNIDEAHLTPQFIVDEHDMMNSDVKMLMSSLEENAAEFKLESSMGMMMDNEAEQCPLIEELVVNWWSTEDMATVDPDLMALPQHSGDCPPRIPLCHMFN